MVAFTLSGLIASIALAYVTTVIAAAVKIMTDAVNEQLCALMKSVNFRRITLTRQRNILLDSAGSVTFVLTTPAESACTTEMTCSHGMNNGFLEPRMTTEYLVGVPATPVLGPQPDVNSVPVLSLDSNPRDTPLITASPYSQNEGLTFPKGTSLWQPQAGSLKTTQGLPSIITESSFHKNESVKFTPGTLLWQPTSSTPAHQQASTPRLWTPANASRPSHRAVHH
jgi:hypothetical protein